jgi:RNA polymerase sigma factor for flagellar operon FliA
LAQPPHDDSPPGGGHYERLLVEHLSVIDRIVAGLARRKGLSGDDRDDFSGWARLRLIEGDYAILRKFDERGTFRGYLATVLSRLLKDYRDRLWGKWRPSALASSHGEVGILLEKLVKRDGMSVSSAIQVLRSRSFSEPSDLDLAVLAASFPDRGRPHIEADSDKLVNLPDDSRPDHELLKAEAEAHRAQLLEHLAACLGELDPEDQVFLRLVFWKDLTIADTARYMGLKQRPLYRRLERLRERLKTLLEDRGISHEDVQALLGEITP